MIEFAFRADGATMGEHDVLAAFLAVLQFHPEHRPRQDGDNPAFDFDCIS